MGYGWTSSTLLLWALGACSSALAPSARDVADANDTGRALTAANESERQLLRVLPNLPAGTVKQVGDASVVADAAYTAASGRTCRSLHLTMKGSGQQRDRLACSSGDSWFFVPDVFGGDSATD